MSWSQGPFFSIQRNFEWSQCHKESMEVESRRTKCWFQNWLCLKWMYWNSKSLNAGVCYRLTFNHHTGQITPFQWTHNPIYFHIFVSAPFWKSQSRHVNMLLDDGFSNLFSIATMWFLPTQQSVNSVSVCVYTSRCFLVDVKCYF